LVEDFWGTYISYNFLLFIFNVLVSLLSFQLAPIDSFLLS
jgi:hypothetical protein